VKNKNRAGALALAFCAAMLAFGNSAVFAASTAATPSASNQVLKVSPIKTDVTVPAGTTGTVKILVSNISDKPITVQPIENDFVAGGENGQPALVLDPNSYAPSHSLKRFMVPLNNVTIAAHDGAQVTVSITVPKVAQAGGYFGAIRFSPIVNGSSSGSSVALSESVASLILMTVPGPTTEQLTMTNFAIQQNGSSSTNFRTPNNLSLFVRFLNKGNLQESPFGQIDVQKGKKVVYSYNFNQADPKKEILPDSARRWTVPLKGFGKFGKYTISGTFTYGTKGETIDVTKTVWIIPTAYIIVIIIIVVLLVLLIGGGWLFLKSYKRRILKSSRRRY
jgi:hypothetical protein